MICPSCKSPLDIREQFLASDGLAFACECPNDKCDVNKVRIYTVSGP